jgi:hypothetical protein
MRNRHFESDFNRRQRSFDRSFAIHRFIVTLGMILVFGFVAYGFYENFASDKFSLRKDEYSCTASHIEANHNEVYTICDTYQRVNR